MSEDDDQLALEVDPSVLLTVVEIRHGQQRTLRVGPLAEPDAHALAGLLLNRGDEPLDGGPWRCAIAGGTRTVTLSRLTPS